MQPSLLRQYGLLALTILMLILTAIRFWPGKHPKSGAFPGPGGPPTGMGPGALPDDAMRERMENAVKDMPPEQRQAFETRMKADREFFASVRDLPEDQRRER